MKINWSLVCCSVAVVAAAFALAFAEGASLAMRDSAAMERVARAR